MKKVLIGLSWPYANGRLHIGHVASSLPADALARFHRSIGNEVSFVTGSDCYGTPILVRAMKEGTTPTELAGKYHAFHDADFKALGFTFTLYDKTTSERHHAFVKKFHEEMYKGEYIYEHTADQLYCEKCDKFLPDRYVEGVCPFCGKEAKGDSCDHCGKILEPEDLLKPHCLLCCETPVRREQTQLYLKLSALQERLEKFFDERKNTWTVNAVGLTSRYLKEGLRDRAITRSINWGIPIPKNGWDDRKIYIWAENVLGYLSASEPEFLLDGQGGAELLHYYVHGKDNIPFHSIILPALLMAHGGGYHLPDRIIAGEYITIKGDKISKSKGNQISAHTLYENFDVDMIRYFFLRNVSDKRDSNFTPEEFVNIINGELVNNFGNLVNRTLSFVNTKYNGQIPKLSAPFDVANVLQINYKQRYDGCMERGETSDALKLAMEIVNYGNKHFADGKPWQGGDNAEQCVAQVIEIIKTAVRLLAPFIPNGCEKVTSWLYDEKGVPRETLPPFGVLYQRLDIKEVEKVLITE